MGLYSKLTSLLFFSADIYNTDFRIFHTKDIFTIDFTHQGKLCKIYGFAIRICPGIYKDES